jgi:DNA-binding XRE family transcriptional regulator
MDSKELYIELGKKIKALRIENNVTQAELAIALNLQRTSVTNIEAGKQSAPLHVYFQICSFFKENLIDFIPSNFSSVQKMEVDSITCEQQISEKSPKLAEVIRKISAKFEQEQTLHT